MAKEIETPAHRFIKSKFTIPKGKKLTDDALIKMSIADLKGWLDDYYSFRLKEGQKNVTVEITK